MARIFNICFQHKGKPFTALVSILGQDDDNYSVSVSSNNESIQIMLPTGRLIIPIPEILQRLPIGPNKENQSSTVYITEKISLQLMNTSW
jgi:hypothetical protein